MYQEDDQQRGYINNDAMELDEHGETELIIVREKKKTHTHGKLKSLTGNYISNTKAKKSQYKLSLIFNFPMGRRQRN